MYGTNDWNTIACQTAAPCDTIDEMRELIHNVKDFGSLPVLSTIIPVNPNLQPAARNDWVRAQNGFLKDLARAEGIPVADPAKLFFAQSNLATLFSDGVHPNDAGYDLIAQAFFEGVTGPRSVTMAGAAFTDP
jgi:lysophospholipase L1-like esterase